MLLFGTNDYQNVEVDGEVLEAARPEWLAEYHRRVGLRDGSAAAAGLTVTWVALPAMRSGEFSAAMARLSEVYRAEAEKRPWVDVVDGGAAIDGTDGGYATTLSGADGTAVEMRQDDGIHLSRAGADRAAVGVWDNVVQRWDLPDGGGSVD